VISNRCRALVLAVALSLGACRAEEEAPLYFASECLNCVSQEEIARCRDQFDNDKNGYTDCDDPVCRNMDLCKLKGLEQSWEACHDSIDNDGNGKTDCQEDKAKDGTLLCSRLKLCCLEAPGPDGKVATVAPETSPEACSDGIDNDCNGYLDCGDKNCWSNAISFCEGNNANCEDGLDNDGNGYTDCADFACSKNTNVTVCQ
jgi:hypothetical protein